MNMKTQIITDFIIRLRTGKLMQVSHRNNDLHKRQSMSLGMCSEVLAASYENLYVGDAEVDKFLGEELNLFDFYNSYVLSGVIVAKSKRIWDYSKPIGERLVSQKTTKQWMHFYSNCSNVKGVK